MCVRVQSMNGVNINLFQFDYDLTWMAFFMDAHDGIYARYGGREDHDAESHLTKPSLLRVMRFSGFFPLWYIAVAVAIGPGRKACTWSAR